MVAPSLFNHLVLVQWAQALWLFAHHSTLQTTWAVMADPDAFEVKPTDVLGRSSTLSNLDFFKISMPFCIASSPVHNRFETCASSPYAVGSVSTRDPPIFWIRTQVALPDGLYCRCPARLSRARDDHWSEFVVHFFCPRDWHLLTLQRLCESWPKVFVCHVPVPQLHFVHQVSIRVVVPLCQCAC